MGALSTGLPAHRSHGQMALQLRQTHFEPPRW